MRSVTTIRRLSAGCAAAAIAAFAGASGASGVSAVRPARAARAIVHIVPQVRLADPRPPVDLNGHHSSGLRPVPAAGPIAGGYTPAQIRAAYFMNPLLRRGIRGKGQSIVIVDSFGSPTIRHDLAVFDKQFKIAAPPSLMIIHPAGKIPPYNGSPTRASWAFETTLDVEWSHAMAPGARIVLVETPTSENEGVSGFPQIVKAEKYVIAHHLGGVISQSFGATEETFPKGTLRPLRGAYLQAARPANNVTVVSASGDAGATDFQNNMRDYFTHPVTSWPASDPLVTSVGGLDLALNSRGQRLAPDQVWNDQGTSPSAGGGGKSIMFSRPAYQNVVASVVGSHRGVPDISMSASCRHPVNVYGSFPAGQGSRPGWFLICGTSEATPLFAGVIALADQLAGRPLGPINGYLYQMMTTRQRGIVDITRGNNTVSFTQHGKSYTVQGWTAVPGYDLASGIGTIEAKWFVPELVAMFRRAHHS